MNVHEYAIKLRQIASDILNVSEAMSGNGEILHADALRVTAVVVESILKALHANTELPDVGMREYRDAFVAILDSLVLKMQVRGEQ